MTVLKVKRDMFSARSKDRSRAWVDQIDQSDCKNICDGAMKAAVINPITEASEDKLLERTIFNANKTYYDRIYLRNYEPDCIKRLRNGETPYLNDHLGTQAYHGDPNTKFKNLLKQRNITAERQKAMYFTEKPKYDQNDKGLIDLSKTDNQMLYNPDFRAPPKNFYKTIYTNQDRTRERGFNLNLNQSFKGKTDPQVWPQNSVSLNKKDPYIDGLEIIGKLKRDRSKERDITPKEFMVNTSTMNTTLNQIYSQNKSLRQLENIKLNKTLTKNINLNRDTSLFENSGSMKNLLNNTSTHILTKQHENRQKTLNFADTIPSIQNTSVIKKPSLTQVGQPIKSVAENNYMSLNTMVGGQTLKNSSSKLYFKSLELGNSYHNNKRVQKKKIEEEISQLKSKTALEFKILMPYANQTLKNARSSIHQKRMSLGLEQSQSSQRSENQSQNISQKQPYNQNRDSNYFDKTNRNNFSMISFKNQTLMRFATPGGKGIQSQQEMETQHPSKISLRLRTALYNERSSKNNINIHPRTNEQL
eukprot:403360913